MKKEIYNFNAGLIIPEKENVFKRFFKWVSNLFKKAPNEEIVPWTQEPVKPAKQNITVPKAVQMPLKITQENAIDENSLEYLYELSDEELDDLDQLYDAQMNEAKNEIERLDGMLQSYKNSIKDLQNQVADAGDVGV